MCVNINICRNKTQSNVCEQDYAFPTPNNYREASENASTNILYVSFMFHLEILH